MKAILREPLLHFLLLGTALFVLYGLVSKRGGNEPGRILVTQGDIASMAGGFTRTWQRPPTQAELDGLIRDRVREEVYYREALALGLDKDDTIIRRRLRQKMEFLSDDLVAQASPTDAELTAYLAAHPDPFRVERTFTFSQVYLDPGKHGDHLARDTAELLARLKQAGAKADVSALGDSVLLEHSFAAVPASDVAKQLGEQFAAKLGEVAVGEWQAPVESGYGVHLVFVNEHTEGRLSPLNEVRDAVAREWANARRLEANDKLYADMLKRYAVTIEARQGQPQAAELLDGK